jgi:hypothetical protein
VGGVVTIHRYADPSRWIDPSIDRSIDRSMIVGKGIGFPVNFSRVSLGEQAKYFYRLWVVADASEETFGLGQENENNCSQYKLTTK